MVRFVREIFFRVLFFTSSDKEFNKLNPIIVDTCFN